MKKILTFFIIAISCCLNVFSQATSLTIDCQTPGWLSSKISYENQQVLENIKVTGFINGTDIKFIRELNLNRSLHGCIDLGDVNIVAGGESYGGYDSYGYSSWTYTKDNSLTPYMFAYLKAMRKVILPESITTWDGRFLFLKTKVDTLVINGNMQSISICDGHDNIFWKVRCIYFPEGIKKINIGYLFHSYAGLSNIEMFFPSSLEKISGNNSCNREETIIHCESTNPETILSTNRNDENCYIFNSGTIYVPKGTKEKYEQSIFNKLTIIEEIPVEGVTLVENKLLYVGDQTKLQAQILPSDALNQKVKWESTNPEIVEVDEDGNIHAIAYGTAVITTTTMDGGYKATCTVNVYEHTTGIEITDRLDMHIGDTYTLNAQTLPLLTSDNRITYKSGNNDIASVNNQGIVTAKKKGSCTITATSVDGGYTATCEVTVIQPVEAIVMEKHSLTMKVGETETLYSQITPATADNKALKWYSKDEKVAKIDDNGNVEALAAGETWLVAISEDNPLAKDSCKLTVLQPVTGIKLNYNTYQLNGIGDSFTLEATILPDDASNNNIKWSSSDESVCIVSRGQVIAVGTGTCVIIANTEDGGYIATCTVTSYSLGDVNWDEKVDISDVICVVNHILGQTPNNFHIGTADVNHDAKVDIVDVISIVGIILNTTTN